MKKGRFSVVEAINFSVGKLPNIPFPGDKIRLLPIQSLQKNYNFLFRFKRNIRAI
jgi:hypothetical protein